LYDKRFENCFDGLIEQEYGHLCLHISSDMIVNLRDG